MTPRRRRPLAAALAIGLVLVAVACSGDDGSPEARPDPTVVEGTVVDAPTGALTGLRARLGGRSPLAGVVVADADEAVRIEATATSADHTVEVPRTALARRQHRLPVVGLRADTTYDIEVRAFVGEEEVGAGAVELTTGSLPDWFPALEVTTSRPGRMAPGLTLFDLQRWGVEVPAGQPNGVLVAVDEEGEVVWYHANPLGTGDARLTDDGTILSLYAPFGFEELDLLGTRVGNWVWGDADQPRRPGTTVIDSPTVDLVSFHHEVGVLPNGNFLVFGRYQRDLTDGEQEAYCPGDPADFGIREDTVMEVTRDGDVVHEWPLYEIVDPAVVPGRELCAVDYEDYRDWAHGNGAVLDVERNAVIVTARHIDLVFAFRYRADADGPSGELLWSIGPEGVGTLPLDGEPSYGLHAPQVTADGSILLFDNGNDRPVDVPYSRAVRYEVDDTSADPADWTARQVWEFRTEDLVTGGPLYADFLGDADLQPNGNVLIGFGGINQQEPPARGRIIEVVPQGRAGGDIVFDLTIPDTWTSYRAERLPSLYTGPRWLTD